MSGNPEIRHVLPVLLTLLVGCDSEAPTVLENEGLAARADAADRTLLLARLAAQGNSHSNGIVLIEIVGGDLTVSLHAGGLEPLHIIPQHLHVNPTCNPGGGILLNLDANLTVPGEGPGVGPDYPVSNHGGVVNYHASRSLTDLLAAVNTYQGAGLTSVEALLAWLDLEDRNTHMHTPDAPFPAITCGAIDRIN